MAPVWRVVVVVEDASGTPVSGAKLTRQIWSGGAVERLPVLTMPGPSFSFEADAAAQSIICELRHPRYAFLAVALVRTPGETAWRWTSPTRQVRTTGHEVTVVATLGRVRAAPLGQIAEDELVRRAGALKERLDAGEAKNAAARARRRPETEPNFVMLDADQRTALATAEMRAYRPQAAIQRPIAGFHVADRRLLGDDPAAEGWGRFATREAAVDPAKDGQLYLVEYGEVGEDASLGPRYAIGVWVPRRLHALGVEKLDFVVWLHPHTNNPLRMPQVKYPFGRPYPYGILAVKADNGQAIATQRFLDIPVYHLLSQHFLAYQLLAARRAAVLVVPVAPSSHFEPFEAPSTLMRLLKELCLWIPRDDDRGQPAVHPRRPAVGRVVMSGFSASVPRLTTLMNTRVPDSHYAADVWGTRADASAFDGVWKEQWAIDGVAAGFDNYLNQAASWVRTGPDRRIRIYKSDFTGGRWNPLAARRGPWGALVRGAKPEIRQSGKLFGLWCADPQERWHAASFSNDFVLGPASGPAAGARAKARHQR